MFADYWSLHDYSPEFVWETSFQKSHGDGVQLDTTDRFLQCALNYLLFPRCVFLLSFRV